MFKYSFVHSNFSYGCFSQVMMGFIKEWQDKLGVTIVCSQVGVPLGSIHGHSSTQPKHLLPKAWYNSSWA